MQTKKAKTKQNYEFANKKTEHNDRQASLK